MYVSAMTNNCPLSDWGHNSRIDHGTADVITGPYVLQDVAINTWAHNSAPIALKDGTFAIVHIGTGTGAPNGGTNCNQTVAGDAFRSSAGGDGTFPKPWHGGSELRWDGGSTIHVSKSLNGPWLPLMNNTLGGCNNPAPWVHPNGTIYCLCGSSVLRTESISGPWDHIASLSHSGGPPGNYEDPFLYTDARGFHLIYHVYNTQENPPHGHECE